MDWKNSWAEKLRTFESISVRDLNSQLLVKAATGVEPEIVLDPCLQFSTGPANSCSDNAERRFIAVYGHNFSTVFAREVRRYAERRRFPLISIGYRNDWADEQWITADRNEFATFIA
ncbi:MAG TPA: hypothetical protein VEK08_09765 [Planctomycetota bacterium]|nr:hypothetical protein [Planctomycetota bacterium]